MAGGPSVYRETMSLKIFSDGAGQVRHPDDETSVGNVASAAVHTCIPCNKEKSQVFNAIRGF